MQAASDAATVSSTVARSSSCPWTMLFYMYAAWSMLMVCSCFTVFHPWSWPLSVCVEACPSCPWLCIASYSIDPPIRGKEAPQEG